MAARKSGESSSRGRIQSTPAQPIEEIEREIVGDLDDLPEDETPSVPRERARQVGAINAEAVQANRKRATIRDRKRDGEKNVPWGESDACMLYDDIISLWPISQLLIYVKRVSGGSQVSYCLRGQPRNGRDLYEAIRTQCHGQAPEAEYQVVVRDSHGREERGRGRVMLPSTEFDAMSAPATGIPRESPTPSVATAPMPQASPMATPGGGSSDPIVIMNIQRQLSELQAALVAATSGRVAPPPPSPPPHHPYPNAPPPPVVMMPSPPPPPPPPPPAPMPQKVPDIPPGYALTTLNGFPVLVPLQSLGLGSPAATAPVAAAASSSPAPLPTAPPAQPVDQFASAIGTVKSAFDFARTVQSILPAQGAAAASVGVGEPVGIAAETDDGDPTQTVKIGEMNVVKNKDDGSVRLLDTAVANAPAIFGWLEKQRAELQQRQQGQGQVAAPQPQQSGQVGGPVIPQ
jgi:hypothetical protein